MKRMMLLFALLLAAAVAFGQEQQTPPSAPPPPAPARKMRMGQGMRGGMGQRMQAMMRKQIIYPPDFRPDMPFSPGVRVGGILFVAGQTGSNLKTGKLADSFEGEVRTALDNIGLILKAAGMDFPNVVSVTVYLTDMSKFADMNKVYTEYFKADRPARATVGVAKLVGTAQVEISVIAHQ